SGALSGDEVKAHSHFRTDGSAVPIYAPTDMTLTQGTWVGASNDYGLIFEVNARYRIALGHVTSPRADIVSRISTADPSSRYEDVAPLVFAAGELIGTSTGTAAVNGIDFGLYDLAQEASTPNTQRYRDDRFWQKLHGVCPYAHFAAPLRPGYTARFGTIGGVGLPGAPCRVLADQSSGGIGGEWTLVSHAPDGTYQARIALGTHLGDGTVRIAGLAGTLDVPGGVDPRTVTTEICYEAGGSYTWLRRTSPTTLDVVWGLGACPAAFPATGFRSYER
ncbi:MAG: hypothetical protein QNJ90_15855, partial [Planctomycetota bacterium]|nr:hypothetical protein [Planctomycetota bacterium]